MLVMTDGVRGPDYQRGDNRRLILAALIPLAAFGLQWIFWSSFKPFAWFLFYPAVFFGSWVGGLRGGLVATVLSTGLGWYFFIPEESSFAVQRPIAFLSIAVFMGMGVLFSLFHGRLRAANRQAAEALAAVSTANDQMEERVRERTAKLEQTANALRESELEFRTLAESMPQIAWVTRPDGWTIYCNRQWVDYTGMTVEESCGHGWSAPFHPDDKQRAWDAWQRATQNNETYALEGRLRRADGTYRWWLIRGVPLRDPEGKTLKWFGTCTDIEDIKQADAALRKNQAKLDVALASMADAVFISDAEGRFIEFNEAFATFHKFRNKEECAKTLIEYPVFLDVFLPNGDLAPLDQCAVPRALRGETVANAEYTLRRKDTGETWIGNYSFAPIRDKDGTIVGSVVTGRDITERRRVEQELQELTNLLKVAGRTARFGGWSVNLADGRVFWSEEVAAIHEMPPGFSPSVTEGINFYAPEWRERISTVLAACARDGTPYDEEMQIITAQGRRVWVRVIGEAVRTPAGAIIEVQGAFQDVTERKQAEEKLKRTHNTLVEAQKIAHLGSFEYVAATRTTVWSEEEYRIYGLDPTGPSPAYDEMLAKCIHPDDVALLHESFTKAMQSCSVYQLEHRIVRPDGSVRWVYDLAHPYFDDQGELVRYVGTTLDITERKRGVEALRMLTAELERRVRERTAQLERANKELEAFSYSVSHDLRAPLRHIHGYTEMLARDVGDRLSENGRHFLQTILAASQEMSTLIDDLLAFSRVGRAEMREVRVELDTVVQEALRGLESATSGRNIVWKIPPLPAVQGNPAMLRQVFANLLGNALKYTRPRDPAKIEVGCAGEENGQVILFVRDNGVGFDPCYAGKLFGVFQRLHRADEFEGTGIGLANVRRIIARHGGRTWAEGALNQGATFFFTLRPQ